MKRKLKLIFKVLPSYIPLESKPGLRQDGFKLKKGIPIQDLTREEAEDYADMMRDAFIDHWKRIKFKN